MASSTVSVTRVGDGDFLVEITGTSYTTSTEVVLTDTTTGLSIPSKGTIRRCIVKRSAGSGASLQPEIRRTSGGSGVNLVYQAASTLVANTVDDAPDGVYVAPSVPYFAPAFDAGSDNDFTAEIMVSEGWI